MDFLTTKSKATIYIFGILFLFTAALPAILQEFGLDSPLPVNPYLNGNIPERTPQPAGGAWVLENAFPNLDFIGPIHMAQEPGGNRIMVAEHDGRIWTFSNNSEATEKEIFLNLRERDQVFRQAEAGLLNFAFHPDYGVENFYVYVLYVFNDTSSQSRYDRLSRFEVPVKNGIIDPESEEVLIHQFDRNSNHNGGGLAFDTSGYLYISLGDEGGANNLYENAQSIEDRFFGGVLRIDVDQDSSRSHPIRRQPKRLDSLDQSFTANYFIPNDNPWISEDSAFLEEFYAIGLRNPHRMTIDPETNEGWIGDVGQGRREEINLLFKGANYQWSYKEGELDSRGAKPDSLSLIGVEKEPYYFYGHQGNDNCVIGGYVYHGQRHPSLEGKYFFADNGSKKIRILHQSQDSVWAEELLTANQIGSSFKGIVSFALDDQGEIYVLVMNGSGGRGGKIYRLAREMGAIPDPPLWLSQTGAFKNTENLVPSDFLIPYEPRHSFWSDGAIKKRWMAIPNNGTYDSAEEKIDNRLKDEWNFPKGSVFIKHFEMPLHENSSQITRRLETRFLVHGEDDHYYGFTYKWEPDGKDARLLLDGLDETYSVIDRLGNPQNQTWHYPSRDECLSCHQAAVGTVLGASTFQLNESINYPLTGRTSNQLVTLSHLGMLSQAISTEELPNLSRIERKEDFQVPLDLRARSYLDVNCSSCHSSQTGLRSEFDTRFFLPLDSTNMINGLLVEEGTGSENRLIVPGDTAKSMIYQRMKSLEEGYSMPPTSKNRVDKSGLELIANWILSMEEGGKLSQVLNIVPISDKFVNDLPFPLEVEASSGLPVELRFVEGPAILKQDSLFLTGEAGLVIVEASQQGDASYSSAEPVEIRFQVRRIEQQIIFTKVDDLLSNSPGVALEAQATSGLPVSIELVSGPAEIRNDSLFVIGSAGFITLRANQEGDGIYQAAPPITQVIHVTEFAKASQQISAEKIPDKNTLDPPFLLSAESSADLEVTYTVLQGPAQIFGNSVVLNGTAGEVIIEYNQPGDSIYANAQPLKDTFKVSRISQFISFTTLEDISINQNTVTLEASSSSGLPIQFSLIDGPASLIGNTLSIERVSDTIIVEAFQEGNKSFAPASPVRQSFFVNKLGQTLSLPPIGTKTVLDPPFALNAFSNSGLSLDYEVEGPGRVSNDTLYLLGKPGEIEISIWQVGNAGFEPSDTTFQSFSVTKVSQEILFFAIPNLELNQKPLRLRAETNTPNKVKYTAIDGPITVRNDTLFLTGEEGVAEVEARIPGDSLYIETSQNRRFTISKAFQEIRFSSIPDKLISDAPFVLDLQTNSELPITVNLIKGPALLSGIAIFLTGEPGEVELVASQEGNDIYQAATPVNRVFQVIDTSLEVNDSLTTSIPTGIEQSLKLRVFPNPTESKIQVLTRTEIPLGLNLLLYSSSGKELMQKSFPVKQQVHSHDLDLRNLPSGIYLLRIEDNDGKGLHANSLIVKH